MLASSVVKMIGISGMDLTTSAEKHEVWLIDVVFESYLIAESYNRFTCLWKPHSVAYRAPIESCLRFSNARAIGMKNCPIKFCELAFVAAMFSD